MKTLEQLLAMPKGKLGVELAKVLTPGPWKHKWDTCGQNALNKCQKCGKPWASSSNAIKRNFSCPVPDPLDTEDWNVAMKWRDWITREIVNSVADEMFSEISKVENRCFVYGAEPTKWWLWNAQPKHYLIAAYLAAGRKNDNE